MFVCPAYSPVTAVSRFWNPAYCFPFRVIRYPYYKHKGFAIHVENRNLIGGGLIRKAKELVNYLSKQLFRDVFGTAVLRMGL